ncbi:putative beta-lysine N-acetyltransferase [Bacillus sp. REN3]|uniref:putative beta-lysine N-acetyltransferase n=1 Tax=Bacillus sp. REN3 TaxID=2802440 RepID=UPI001AEE1BF7|nr:putative beta-lysine N-acetyltransferase [Bacillus sp. REN3]
MHPGKSVSIAEDRFQLTIYIDNHSRRVRVDDYLGNLTKVMEKTEEIASRENADKIIVKARKEHFIWFQEHGYLFEASIDGYYLGTDCCFFSKFLTDERRASEHWIAEDGIINSVYRLQEPVQTTSLPKSYVIKELDQSDAVPLAELYRAVFQVYPTPLNDPDYITKTMEDGTVYYGFLHEGAIVSAASAEINSFYKNAELTDCATLKDHRKHGLMKVLLARLEQELVERGIFCAYSIARALSFGMNAVLFQLGYGYRGRLLKNVYIFDKIENMNVWVKDLAIPPNFGQ